MSKCDVGGIIQGVVSEDGVVKVGSPVRLYDRDNGKLLASTLTKADGSFAFKDVDRESATYMVLATDEDGVAKKNALVFDRIQPVNDTAGATGWVYNWPTLVRGKEALVAYTNRAPTANLPPDIPGQASAWSGSSNLVYPAYGTGSSTLQSAATDTFPGMPGCPFTQVRAYRIKAMCVPGARQFGNHIHGPLKDNYGASGKALPTFTLEAAFNFTTTSVQSIEYNYGRAAPSLDGGINNTTDVITTIAVQLICGANRYVRVMAETAGGAQTTGSGINNSVYVSQVANIDVTSLGTGWKHLAVVVSYEKAYVRLYVDGVFFSEVSVTSFTAISPSDLVNSITGQYDSYANLSVPQAMFLGAPISPISGGYTPSSTNYLLGNSTTYVEFGPFALYEVELTADEVDLHYRALMTSTLAPLLSGYAKAVADLRPIRYWRLDGSDGQEWLPEAFGTRKTAGGLWPVGDSKFVEGPIPGRNALRVSGPTLWMSEYAGIPMNRLRSTVMCWVYREAGKSVPIYLLHGGRKFGSGAYSGIEGSLLVTTAGAIQFGEQLSSMYYWSSPAGAVPEGVWTHIAVSINSATLRCEYFVNGVLAAETVANSGYSTYRPSETNSGRLIGKEDAISVGSTATYKPSGTLATIGGALSDLAMFSLKLTQAQIQTIYESRLLP